MYISIFRKTHNPSLKSLRNLNSCSFDFDVGNMETQIPTLYPTMCEMEDLVSYVLKIEDSGAHRWGIVKVVPPAGWSARPNDQDYRGIADITINSCLMQSFEDANNSGFHYVCAKKKKKTTNANDWMDQIKEKELSPVEYWRQVRNHELKPLYGADVVGTLFDPDVSHWNLSCLRSILLNTYGQGPSTEGVLSPSLYFGEEGSTFGCHTEDMDLYSINFLHLGKPKRWVGVPSAFVRKVENLMEDEYQSNFKECSGTMKHKLVLINPETLREKGIPCGSVSKLPYFILMKVKIAAKLAAKF